MPENLKEKIFFAIIPNAIEQNNFSGGYFFKWKFFQKLTDRLAEVFINQWERLNLKNHSYLTSKDFPSFSNVRIKSDSYLR